MATNNSHADRHTRHQATFTRKEAIKSNMCDKRTYDETAPFVPVCVQMHQAAGTPSREWEPPEIVGHKVSEKWVIAAANGLDSALKKRIDGRIDAMGLHLDTALVTVSFLEKFPSKVTTVETSNTLTGQDAVALHNQHSNDIDEDLANGLTHHRRTPRWLKFFGRWSPWVEVVAFFAFITYYLNVNLLNPFVDPVAWGTAVIIVLMVIFGQRVFVHQAAREHNNAREQKAEGNRHAGEASRHRRNGYLAVTAVIAIGITGGMILRAVANLGTVASIITLLMIVLAALTGLLMPAIAYVAEALDGSTKSRERDGLADDEDTDLAEHDGGMDRLMSYLEGFDEMDHQVTDKVVPEIMLSAQACLNPARVAYSWLRIQIGGLPQKPPERGRPTLATTESGSLTGTLSTGIPGADALDLQSVRDRGQRIQELRVLKAQIVARKVALRPHPWANPTQEQTLSTSSGRFLNATDS